MVKDLEFQGKINEKVKNVFNNTWEFEGLIELVEKIGEKANIGNLEYIRACCYPFTNDLDMCSNNSEIHFVFSDGMVEIFDGLIDGDDNFISSIRIYDNEDKQISEFSNYELECVVDSLREEVLEQAGELAYPLQEVIIELLELENKYVIDCVVDLSKFGKEEANILKKAIDILKKASE
jgi:hypothetical protein